MTEKMKMETLGDARALMKWVAMGIQPSQESAAAAREIVRQAQQGACGEDLSDVIKDLGFCAMGVLPSRERAIASIGPLDRAVQAIENRDSMSLRERYMSLRG